MAYHNIRITFELEANRKLTYRETLWAIYQQLHLNEDLQENSISQPFTTDFVKVVEKDFIQTPIT